MNKKIFVIRHGETNYNRSGLVQGRGIDAPLNELGLRQAELFYKFYKHIKFDKVYTSSLVRTKQTVKGFIDAGVPYESYSGFDEISWGNQEGLKVVHEVHTGENSILKRWASGDLTAKYDKGESPLDVMNRQKEIMTTLLKKENEKTILICMHGRAMRILLSWMSNCKLSEMDQFKHTNTCLYKIEYDGRFVIKERNLTEHLVGLDITKYSSGS